MKDHFLGDLLGFRAPLQVKELRFRVGHGGKPLVMLPPAFRN
jgi:hypothetical protein